MSGIELIGQERQEQIEKHGRTLEQDKEFNNEYQLSDAVQALVLAVPQGMEEAYIQGQGNYPPVGWDTSTWKKMLGKSYKERLIIAGALVAAEIDRINN